MTERISPISDEDRWAVVVALMTRYTDLRASTLLSLVEGVEKQVAERAMSGALPSRAWWRAALFDGAVQRIRSPRPKGKP